MAHSINHIARANARRYVGIELKQEYFDVACKFLAQEEFALTSQMGLFANGE